MMNLPGPMFVDGKRHFVRLPGLSVSDQLNRSTVFVLVL